MNDKKIVIASKELGHRHDVSLVKLKNLADHYRFSEEDVDDIKLVDSIRDHVEFWVDSPEEKEANQEEKTSKKDDVTVLKKKIRRTKHTKRKIEKRKPKKQVTFQAWIIAAMYIEFVSVDTLLLEFV